MAGARAERIAYLFSAVPRGPLLAGTYRWAPVPLSQADAPTRDELDALVILHMANLAEQARADDGSPGTWLASVREWAQLVIDSEAVGLPDFLARLAGFSKEDESLVRWTYRTGVRSAGTAAGQRADRLALATSVCQAIAEPSVWLAHLACCRGDFAAARRWAICAVERLLHLGTAWDKRLSFDQWREVAEALADPRADKITGSTAAARHPGELFERVVGESARPTRARRRSPGGERAISPPDAAAASERFHRDIATLAEGDRAALGAIYPDLPSQPWLDPGDFPLAAYLESHYNTIRQEILALDPSTFHRESERSSDPGGGMWPSSTSAAGAAMRSVKPVR